METIDYAVAGEDVLKIIQNYSVQVNKLKWKKIHDELTKNRIIEYTIFDDNYAEYECCYEPYKWLEIQILRDEKRDVLNIDRYLVKGKTFRGSSLIRETCI